MNNDGESLVSQSKSKAKPEGGILLIIPHCETTKESKERIKMADEKAVLEAIELARNSGKIRKGVNEVTKAIEKGEAKLVAIAKDVVPKEIVMHLPLLSKERGIPCMEIPSKEELGTAAGLAVPTAAVAIVKEGEAKDIVKELSRGIPQYGAAPALAEAPKEEKPAAKPKKKKE